jgi:ribonuclease HI
LANAETIALTSENDYVITHVLKWWRNNSSSENWRNNSRAWVIGKTTLAGIWTLD